VVGLNNKLCSLTALSASLALTPPAIKSFFFIISGESFLFIIVLPTFI